MTISAWLFRLTTAAVLLGGTSVKAHEIGTTRVLAVFQQDRTYNIEIVTDADALLQKLNATGKLETGGAAPGKSSPVNATPAEMRRRFQAFDPVFRERVRIAFGTAEVHPATIYKVEPPVDAVSATAVTIRLTGEIPATGGAFNWNFGWTFASYALTLRSPASENTATQWLEGGENSKPYDFASHMAAPGRVRTAARYLLLGYTHIVPFGLDHMLFVLGIYLLSGRIRSVLLQVSAFTVAHSITLGLSMYGLVHVSPRIVEPMIALSIAYVAIENVFLSELKSWRVALVFAFGLLHGMGFAGALKELGLPRGEFVTALLTFNLGVEAGQLSVIAAAFILVGWHCSGRAWYRSRVVVPASAMIACTAIYWTIQRVVF
jgi:hydrogenase/urease accessory protein HupE